MKQALLTTGVLFPLLLVSCSSTNQGTSRSVFSKALTGSPFATVEEPAQPEPSPTKQEPAPEAQEKSQDAPSAEWPIPTPEQQAAAEALQQNTANKEISSHTATPTITTGAISTPFSEPSIPAPATVAPLPGRSLRLGQFAPPEEAASAGEAPALTPNSVDLHGLRSPKLPGALPMDINGKITPDQER